MKALQNLNKINSFHSGKIAEGNFTATFENTHGQLLSNLQRCKL